MFKITHKPLSISEQKEILQNELEDFCEKIKGKMEQCTELPFNIASIKYIQDKMEKKKVKYFVDPEFPPENKSLYDTTKNQKYPFE